MGSLDGLLQWADGQGVTISGIAPGSLPGRGTGMLATRRIKKGEVVMKVPIRAIRSLHTVPEAINMKLDPDMPIHGLLAAELALDPPTNSFWGTLVPQPSDFEASTPFFWSEELQRLLPDEAAQLLHKQQNRLGEDWDMFTAAFPDIPKRDFVYAWFLVSTRGFYYETSEMLLYPWVDRLALLPVADLFNHSASGCNVTFTSKGYTVETTCEYDEGDEVCFSYGEHSNDFLLAEYGFCLEENHYDKVSLDGIILGRLTAEQRATLEDMDKLGEYCIDAAANVDERTREAIQVVNEGCEATLTVTSILGEFLEKADEVTKAIAAMGDEQNSQKASLATRWAQLEGIAKRALAAETK